LTANPQAAPWNVPAAAIATSPRSADWARRLWNGADRYDHDWSIEFGLDAPGNDYSIPVYSTVDATTTTRIFQRPVAGWNGHFDVANGSAIPWNPSWMPSDGSDGFVVVLDPGTGKEWDIWALTSPAHQSGSLSSLECSLDVGDASAGFDADVDLCAASVNLVRSPDGKAADVRSYRGNSPGAGGAGLQNSVALTTPAEVASGVITHALKFSIAATMTGPACGPEVTTPDDPQVGTTCGVAVAPAGQFERGAGLSTPADLAGMVPEGTRVVIDRTDAQIESWLDSRALTGALRRTARTFAVALRDYGLIVTDSSPGPAFVQVSGGRNPATATGWRALGITDDGSNLLAGLVTETDIRVLEPAVNQCAGGTSRLQCWASASGY
jgi:hypothetical protein